MFVNSFIREKEVKRQNKLFNDNMRKWITKDTDKGGEIPSLNDYLHNFDELPPECKILAWDGLTFPDRELFDKLISWVERGGGLICGVCPWGFVQIFNKRVQDMPLNHIFKVIGVVYAGEVCYENDTDLDEIAIKDNMAEYVKPQDLVAALTKHPEKIGKLSGLIQNVFQLPNDIYDMIKT